MKILLDENLPSKLKLDFAPDIEVKTVQDMQWSGKKNGELLALAVENNFNILITVDKNLQYQQNLTKFPLTIFVLNAKNNKHQTLQPMIDKVKKYIKPNLEAGLIEIS